MCATSWTLRVLRAALRAVMEDTPMSRLGFYYSSNSRNSFGQCECADNSAWLFYQDAKVWECQTCGATFNYDGFAIPNSDAWGYQFTQQLP